MIKRIVEAVRFRWRKFFEREIPEVPYAVKRSIILKYSKEFGFKNFVETGTFFGETVEFFRTMFPNVISIELQPDFAAKAKQRFADFPNVKILEGDSGILIKEVVANLQSPAVFWLDGHYSSEFFVGDEFVVTAKSDKNTPVEKELEAILSSELDHLILIDDARDFTGRYDYPSLKAVKQIVSKFKPGYQFFVESDIIHIIPPNIK